MFHHHDDDITTFARAHVRRPGQHSCVAAHTQMWTPLHEGDVHVEDT